MMKKIQLYISTFLLLMIPFALAQQQGIVEGRVINKTNPSIIVRSVELDVVELGAGMRIVKTTTTDSSGKYRVDGIPGNGRYMVRVNYRDVNYHRQFNLEAAGKANIDLEVYEPTTSMKDIQVESSQMAFQLAGDQLKSLQTITFNNKTQPPKTLLNPEGNFRFSKPAGITDLPQMRVTAPGSSMPLVQPPLESQDGQSYYSLYPLKPGVTAFEVQQILPYRNHTYTYRRTAYQDIPSTEIGVNPQDMELSGPGLTKLSADSQQNFMLYRSDPIKSGTEVTWIFSGGTPVSEPPTQETSASTTVQSVPDSIRRNALFIGPLLLMGFVLVLWYSFNRMPRESRQTAGYTNKELKERREQLLNAIAALDSQYEAQALSRPEFLRQREEYKRQLRRISLLQK